MTNRRRVSPGEPARRNRTADHYNDAIPTTIRGTNIPEERYIHREEVIYCVVDSESPTVPSNERYVTVAVLDLKRRADLDAIVPRTSTDAGLIDDCNWGVAQEGVLANDTCLTCIGGLTRAKVIVSDPAHKYVTWDEVLGTLVSHPFGGKAYLIEPGSLAVGDDKDIALIYISKCSDVEIIPIMRFFADTKILNREFDATVDIINANVPNPNNGGKPYKKGDTVRIHDPGNLFAEIEPNGTGFAYYRRTDQPSAPLSWEERWEVEQCSLPISRIEGKIVNCLLHTDSTATVKFGSVNGHANYILTSWPNVDFPPEITINAANDFEVQVANPYHLDATENSLVTIRRWTDIQASDPRNLVSPKPASATTEGWEIMHVYEQIARWAKFTAPSFTISQFWEGGDPAPCSGDTVTCAFDCSCLEAGDEIIGFYDPIANSYIGISTASALLGPPDDINVLVETLTFDGDNCYIKYKQQTIKAFACGTSPADLILMLPTVAINSLDNLYVSGSEVCAAYTKTRVIACALVGTGAFCVDICPILCLCEEIYSLPDACVPPPPPPCNCCDCLFVQGPTALQITWDGDTHGTTNIDSGFLEDPCLWRAIFPDPIAPSGTVQWTIRYNCDGTWEAGGPWPGGTNNGTPLALAGAGDCSGSSSLIDNGVSPAATGTLDADGIVCDPPEGACCDEWSGDEEVTIFEGRNFDDWEIDLIAGSYPIVGVGCGATATLLCRVTNSLFGGEFCDVTVELTVEYDYAINGVPEDEGCRWHYAIPACVLQGGEPFPGDAGAIFDCLTGGCEGALGTCGVGGFLALTLQILDPDGSVVSCLEPAGP